MFQLGDREREREMVLFVETVKFVLFAENQNRSRPGKSQEVEGFRSTPEAIRRVIHQRECH